MGDLVDIGDTSLAVRRGGRGPAVLLIHGTAPATWGELPQMLARTHNVIDYDRRGFGESAGPAPRTLSGHAGDAARLIEQLGAAPAVIVGWSVGGVIALELACRDPHLVSALVLLEPPFRAKRHARPAMVGAIASATLLGKLGRSDAGAQRFLRRALARRDGTTDLDRLDRDAIRAASATIVAELAAGTGEHLDRHAISALRVPTTIIAGSESDPAFAAAAHRLGALVPGSRCIAAPGSGHAVALDAPDLVAGAVTALCTQQTLDVRELAS